MKKRSDLGAFLNTEELFAKKAVKAPDAGSALSIVSLFLRDYRGRNDFAAILPKGPKSDFLSLLDELKNWISSGDLFKAEKILLLLKPSSEEEKSELEVTASRLHILQGRIDIALASTESALQNPSLSGLSRMTCHQLRGHCRILQKSFEEAIFELNQAIALSEAFSLAGSAFSSHAFLVQAYSEAGNREEAARVLGVLASHLESITQDELWLDRLLTVARAEVHFHRIFKEYRNCHAVLSEAKEISRWLGDQVTCRKCEAELLELAQTPGISGGETAVHKYAGWIFLPSRHLILAMLPKRIERLKEASVASKVLTALSRKPIASDALFESIWAAKYHPEKHGNHLRVTLSNLRKLLPPGALQMNEGLISLR